MYLPFRPRDEYELLSVLKNLAVEIHRCVDAMVGNVSEKCARIEGGLSARQMKSIRKAAALWPRLNDDLLGILERGVIDLFGCCQVIKIKEYDMFAILGM